MSAGDVDGDGAIEIETLFSFHSPGGSKASPEGVDPPDDLVDNGVDVKRFFFAVLAASLLVIGICLVFITNWRTPATNEVPQAVKTPRSTAVSSSLQETANSTPLGLPSAREPSDKKTEAIATPEAPADKEEPLPKGESDLVVFTVDASGIAVAGVVVTLFSHSSSGQVVTNQRGEAAFTRIKDGDYFLRVAAPGRPMLVFTAEIFLEPKQGKTITLRLGEYNLSISGRILNRKGAPLAGIEVEAVRLFLDADEIQLVPLVRGSQRAASDFEGSYEIQGLEDADYELRTMPTPTYPGVKRVVRAGLDSVDLVLEEGQLLRVHGRVTNREGQPLEGVTVAPLWQRGQEARTGADGSYSLEFLLGDRQRTHTLRFSLAGYRESHLALRRDEVGAAEEWELNAELDPTGLTAPLEGIVKTRENFLVAGETVYLQSPSLHVRLQATSDPAGQFSFPEVRLGEDYRLWVRPKGDFKDFMIPTLSVPRNGLHLEIVLEGLTMGEITGQMVDSDGFPVPHFTLWLKNIQAQGKLFEVKGDEEGRFEVAGVPAGSLLFETMTFPRFAAREIELPSGARKDVRLVIDTGPHEVLGTVISSGGDPFPSARVELYWYQAEGRIRSSSQRQAHTDDDGQFKFTEVGKGPHRIRVSAAGSNTVQLEYDVGSGAALPPIRLSIVDRPSARR